LDSSINFDEYKDGASSKTEIDSCDTMPNAHSQVDMVKFYKPNIINIDDWVPSMEDLIFGHQDKAIILPVSKYYGFNEATDLDYFILSPKRCYNKPEMRAHTTHYLNYFEKFYDIDRELVIIYCQLKYIMDFNKEYNKLNFLNDLKRYIIFNRSILRKIFMMNEDNYIIPFKAKKGKYVPSLHYNTNHAKILMQMSLLINMVFPLITHFAYLKNVDNIDGILLEVYDEILDLSYVDIYNKLYETTMTEVKESERVHATLWAMQDIRSKNPTTHIISSIENIMLNIMPKYTYNQNIINFNITSIRMNTGFKVTDIKYEYNFTMLSSSNRDEDFTSEFDRFELTKWLLVAVMQRSKLFELLELANA
jgi:hypothetical protein